MAITNALMQSQIFFFISSVGFIFLWVLLVVLLLYVIRAVNIFSIIMEKVEGDINNIGDTTKEMLEEVRESAVFNFLFRKKKKYKKN